MEKGGMSLSAGGSLVWKADGLGAPSSYQCVPLWTQKDIRQEATTEVFQANMVIFMHSCTKTFYSVSDCYQYVAVVEL